MSVSEESNIPTYIFVGLVLTASFGLIIANFVINPDDLTSMIMLGVHFLVGQAVGCFTAYAIGRK
jgi:membrane protein DedA with SNARE-associated domain